MTLSGLKPLSKLLVHDLVTQAGVDTSAWAKFEGEHPASNPKYCYDWAFWDNTEKVVVLCLWYQETESDAAAIFQRQNYREISASPRLWNQTQRKRARRSDRAIQLAKLRRLPIRVIIVDGSMRSDANDLTRSHVERRMLDPEPWHVASYDVDGNCRLQRGPWPALVVDQFSLPVEGAPDRRPVVAEPFIRSPEVRARVLTRSGGLCESCGAPGFLVPDGRRFLETHHIVPLSEDGPDIDVNVIAICPNEHREAHYGKTAPDLRSRFASIVARKLAL